MPVGTPAYPYRFIPARAGNTPPAGGLNCRRPVHPRSRGEHRCEWVSARYVDGSSPLARGTHGRSRRPSGSPRFIPARAGNTPTRRCWGSTPTVHPRSRGEHTTAIRDARSAFGSSPLARGTRAEADHPRTLDRFIPARAGNTAPSRHPTSATPVHPRSRGEHRRPRRGRGFSTGSSPLARGTLAARGRRRARRRFIPARAGNTEGAESAPDLVPVHPRSRGEHSLAETSTTCMSGSSPLARGTPCSVGARIARHRFIPARAGNTAATAPRRLCAPVHPRSRGEHATFAPQAPDLNGSSPLARGTRNIDHAKRAAERFIPARAGNTSAARRRSPRSPVHPRSRGEHHCCRTCGSRSTGSSPLARGTQLPARLAGEVVRFIPARAGNTRMQEAA